MTLAIGEGTVSLAKTVSMALLGLALAGCTSGTPMAVGRDFSTQEELLRASHWNVLADDTALAIKETVKESKDSFFVEPLDPGMPFARVFREQVTTHMVEKGLRVSLARADAAYRVHFAVQPIAHQTVNQGMPTGGTLLAASALGGIHRLRDVSNLNLVTTNLIVAGAALEVASMTSFGMGPNQEVLITVTVMKGSDMVARRQSLYYVDPKEAHQYAGSAPAAPLAVIQPTGPAELPIREFPVNAR